MKRFWLVLLSLGLVMAFSVSAFAVDVKFNGSYYAAGMYLDKTKLTKGEASDAISTAFYFQRFRLQTDFVVAPGLKVVTRFDAMERLWGGSRSSVPLFTSQDMSSAGTRAENENIAFDWAYIEYASPIGLFMVGYMEDNVWGTIFGDNGRNGPPAGIIKYILPVGPVIVGGGIYKEGDLSYTVVNNQLTTVNATDRDSDKYVLFGIWNINKDMNVGLLYSYSRVATFKQVGAPFPAPNMIYINTLQPYAKLKFGPVFVEAEVWYAWGKRPEFEPPVLGADVKVENWQAYLMANVDLGMVYFGGTFAYTSGDDPTTSDKNEGGAVTAGVDFTPCLIMFSFERTYWVGALAGYNGTSNGSPMSNAWFGQGKVGVRPINQLDINGSVSYAQADKKPTGINGSIYGWEIDVTGTYNITNNLSYMLGIGYWFVGDYYKGSGIPGQDVRDDFLVINKLTLRF